MIYSMTFASHVTQLLQMLRNVSAGTSPNLVVSACYSEHLLVSLIHKKSGAMLGFWWGARQLQSEGSAFLGVRRFSPVPPAFYSRAFLAVFVMSTTSHSRDGGFKVRTSHPFRRCPSHIAAHPPGPLGIPDEIEAPANHLCG